VKLSHDSVAELVNLDESLARNVPAILLRINMYVTLMHAELIDLHKFGEALYSPLLSAGSVTSNSSAPDVSAFVDAYPRIGAHAAPTPLWATQCSPPVGLPRVSRETL
jgi:hypothetical protein